MDPTPWVPIIDASGVHALKALLGRCRRRGIVLVVSGLQSQPLRVIQQMDLHPREGQLYFVDHFDAALALAGDLHEITQPSPTRL